MPLELVSPTTSDVSQPQPTFDIVAVHGLGGDPFSTWTHSKNGKCWIRDFLPSDCKDARILTFGYNTTATIEQLVQNILTICKQLLESLVIWRDQDRRRPLIFVAHSLGGIIVKDALVRAHQDSEYRDIYLSTRGIVFFGTPHRGSEKAKWGDLLRRIVTVVRHAPTNTVVEELNIDSPTLSRISEDFRHIYDSFGLVSFFEQKPTSPLNTMIVNAWSAKLDYQHEVSIGVQEDHINMCRFAMQDEETYKGVVYRIRKLAQLPQHPDKDEVIPSNAASAATAYIDRPNISSNIDKVCTESLDPASQQPKKCLVHGIGGSGKSQICLKFFSDKQNRFHHRFWIDASSEKTLWQDFRRAAVNIGLPVENIGPEEVVSSVLDWLERQTKTWLVVFDDVSAGKPDISKILPGGRGGFILFSSRRRSISWMDVEVQVGGLSPEAACELLLKMSGMKIDRSNKAVEELTRRLKYLPLAICIAGAFIHYRRYSIERYLQEWKSHIFDPFDDPDDGPDSLDATFRMTIVDMSRLNEDGARVASDLLNLIAFLDHKHVSEQILRDAWQYRYNQYQRKSHFISPQHTWIEYLETGKPKAWPDIHPYISLALRFLEKYSLLSIDDGVEETGGSVLSVHSLIHTWIREKSMGMPQRKLWYTKAATILAANFQTERPMSNNLVTHLDHMRETRTDERFDISDIRCNFSDDKSFVASSFADIYSRQGYFVEENDLRTAVYSKLSSIDDPSYRIDYISLLAASYTNLGEHHEASKYYDEAYEIAKDPEFHRKDIRKKILTLQCMGEVARNARDLENHKKAYEWSDKVWQHTKGILKIDPSNKKLQRCYLNAIREKAVSMLALGDADEAVKMLAVKMLEDVVKGLQNLQKSDKHAEDDLLRSRSDLADDLLRFRSDLADDLLRSRSVLADAYSLVGRHEDAHKERKEVLGQRKATIMDPDHPDILIAKECVALSLVGMGQPAEACMQRMEVLEQWKGSKRQILLDYPPLLTVKMNLAHNFEVLSHWRRAEEIYDEVYDCKRQLAAQHHRRHCLAQQCLNHDEALLCVETHKTYRTDEAIEALEGKALAQFQLERKESAYQTYKMIAKIWRLKCQAAPYQKRKYLASMNRLAILEGDADRRIAHRKEILHFQKEGAKVTETDTMTTILYLGLDYHTIKQYAEVYDYLRDVLKEGKELKTMLPKEFKEAEKAYKEALVARQPQRLGVSTRTPPQQGYQYQAHQQGRGPPASGSGRRGGLDQGPRGVPHSRPPSSSPGMIDMTELFTILRLRPPPSSQYRPRG